MYKPIDECRTVAELLEDPARWTQGNYAEADDGGFTESHDTNACRWCVVGAMRRVYRDIHKRIPQLKAMQRVVGFNVAEWNDAPGRTHAEVLEAVKRAGI